MFPHLTVRKFEILLGTGDIFHLGRCFLGQTTAWSDFLFGIMRNRSFLGDSVVDVQLWERATVLVYLNRVVLVICKYTILLKMH